MNGDDYESLKEDIRAHGQREPVTLLDGRVLDGRNRYRACRELGLVPLTREAPGGVDPVAFVVSLNLYRRHLTTEKRREIAEALLKESPGKSDRQIAEQVQVDPKTVASVRKGMVAAKEIPESTTRSGKDGRTTNTARIGKKPKAKAKGKATSTPKPGEWGPAEKPRDPSLFDPKGPAADEPLIVEQAQAPKQPDLPPVEQWVENWDGQSAPPSPTHALALVGDFVRHAPACLAAVEGYVADAPNKVKVAFENIKLILEKAGEVVRLFGGGR
jgi:hypothetical protein